jgi:cell division protein FtsL
MDSMVEQQQQHGGDIERQSSTLWQVCGKQFPRSELVFFSQVIIIYLVVILSLINLTTGSGDPTL